MKENNKKYEHLFSQDPIGAFEKIEQDYIRYFKAAYKIDDMYKIGEKCLNDERVDLLKKDDNMSKEPYIEILPKYSSTNLSKQDLIKNFETAFGNNDIAGKFFDFISKGLMPGLMDKYMPYGHQVGMMKKAFAGLDENGNTLKYKNTVITSGTGSGKTESFLLPLLADIYKEAVVEKWNEKNVGNHKDWYKTKGKYSPMQRKGDARPAAVRALVLYPMNALVEDQIARLRKALDGDEIRELLDNKDILNGNRIYFGSYNGDTIAKKNHELLKNWAGNDKEKRRTFDKKREEVAKELSKIHVEYERILATGNKPEDALYISPRLGGKCGTTAEMVTRWDMQKWSPDIMITNTSMLSIMLMRKAESPIFEQTKRWLAAEDIADESEREKVKKHRIFHIVVDELHLYRGTAGSEVACLLRMLYNALGLKPIDENGNPNPQIKILASSASLGNEDQTQKFLEEFFGLYSTNGEKVFNIQSGSNYIDTLSNEFDKTIDYTKFSFFTHEDFVAIDKDVDPENEEKAKEIYDQRLDMINKFVSEQFNCKDIEEFINKYQGRIFYDFYNVMPENNDGDPDKNKRPSIRPISQNELMEKLFEGDEKALRGFLIFRGFIDKLGLKHNLPQFRFHKFFKYIEGLWGELHPSLENETTPIGNLSYTAQEVGPNNRKVLELLRCESCGQIFIGGNRKKDDNGGSISLTLNYPNLEQIPNFNPTPMVQNKTYKDYAIFWPQNLDYRVELPTGHINKGGADHVVVIENGNDGYGNGYAKWIPGYLDSVTGNFIPKDSSHNGNGVLKDNIKKNGISGFLYQVVDDRERGNEINDARAQMIYAAPCTCPHCLQDYTSRTYTKSPIRSFRTGIDRSNQILSKELIYQLDESKLIGFSDSREDAAKQALGIEKEHYRDMVRMLFIECVEEMGIDDIHDFIMKRRGEGKKWKDIIPEVRRKWVRNDIETVIEAIRNYIEEGDDSGLVECKKNIIKLSELIGNGGDGTLVKKLLEKGINPAGESYRFQWFEHENQNVRNLYHWSEAYDFTQLTFGNPPFLTEECKKEIKKQLISAIFANSFGKYMGVSVLDAGIGYMCGPQSNNIESSQAYLSLRDILSPKGIDVYEFVDAFIRILGDNYYYPSNDDMNAHVGKDYANLKAAVKRHIRNFYGHRYHANQDDELNLGNALMEYLKKHNIIIRDTLDLDINNLYFRMMTDEKYIECPNCHRVHPNIGSGFCTKCMEKLDLNNTIETEKLHEHYISHDILIEKKQPCRLHTEELSGQTDDIQSRLREFKDLILVDNNDATALGQKKTKPIDMVCVTTTMEVGVDIGSLQAIFQGNMPPTRYNYQQRVGRGGRRGQAYSTAFTFCRGRSHDVYYYNKATDEMVGGIPATPTLSLAPYKDGSKTKMKLAILKRVIVKEVLKQAYSDLPFKYELQDTAGEFGFVSDWKTSTTKDILENWISINRESISDIVKRYFDQFNVNGEIKNDIEIITNWINNDLVSQIDTAVNKTTAMDKGLAQYLTESGFLPMYGMPSDSRKFYHGYDYDHNKVKSIDRSSELAISEFAPGAEKTKDKAKYRVEGITVSMKEDAQNRDEIKFFDDSADALEDSYVLSFENQITNGNTNNNFADIKEIDRTDPNNPTSIKGYYEQLEEKEKKRILVIPQAYRSFKIGTNKGTPIDNNDRGSSFVQTQIFAKENSNQTTSARKEVGNVRISIFELGLNEDPTIWHINTNNGYFYKGDYSRNDVGLDSPIQYSVDNGVIRGANFMFYDSANNGSKLNKKTTGLDIALGAKKVTEMIKLELICCPDNLNLDIKKGNKGAIRAAFYSAAFLLQRALADKLDIQPDEIEICEKIDGANSYPSLYLSDALPNGAGIVSYLYQDDNLKTLIKNIVDFKSFDENMISDNNSFMQSIISDDHRSNCLTACQKCLMSYNNRGFHHVLDWRLGVGILRLMLDKNYNFGFIEEDRKKYEELKDWDKIVEICFNKLHIDPKNPGNAIIYHPLWKINDAQDKVMYNTFKLLRSDLTPDNPEQTQNRVQDRFARRTKDKESSNGTEEQAVLPANDNVADNSDDDDLLA